MSIFESQNGYLPWQAYAIGLIKAKKADVLLLSGGFGSGKTAVNAHIMRELLGEKKCKGLSIAYAFSAIRDVLIPTIEEEFPASSIVNINYSPPQHLIFNTELGIKSELLTRTVQYGHEASRRIKSLTVQFLHLLEGTELPLEAFTMGLSRLRGSDANGYFPVLIETNPSSKDHWIYKYCLENAEIQWESKNGHWKLLKKIVETELEGKKITLRCFSFLMTSFANPFYSRLTIAQLKEALSPTEYQRLVLGEWNALEGRVWEMYHTFKHPVKNMKEYAAKYDNIFLGLDPGQDHPTAVSFIGKIGGYYEVFDEITERTKSIRFIHDMIIEKLKSWGFDTEKRLYDIYLEPSGFGLGYRSELQDFSKTLFPILSTHKGAEPVLYRVTRLGELMRTKRLTFSDFCVNHLKDLEQTVYKKSQNGIKETVDKKIYDPHNMDACGYAMMIEVF